MKERRFFNPDRPEDRERWKKFASYYVECVEENGEFSIKKNLPRACEISGYNPHYAKKFLIGQVIRPARRNGYILTKDGAFLDPEES